MTFKDLQQKSSKYSTGAALLILLLTGCKQKSAMIHPVAENITASVYASGKIKSSTQYQLFSPVNGLVQKINVSKGDAVQKDAVIMQLQNSTVPFNVDNAKLAAANAAGKANLDRLAELRSELQSLQNKYQNDSIVFLRQQNLWASGIGTKNELEQKQLQYKNDHEAYEATTHQYSDLERQIKFGEAQSKNNLKITRAVALDYLVRSKLTGKIFDIFIKEGEMVTPQIPLALIGGTSDFIIELQVDEYDITKIHTGQKVLFTMDSYKNNVYEAAVSKIIPMMNDRTRSFTVEAIINVGPPVLYPNLTVDANIVTSIKNNALVIPREYLTGDTMVLLKNGKPRHVKTGIMDYTKAEIIDGLTKDDIIVKPVQ